MAQRENSTVLQQVSGSTSYLFVDDTDPSMPENDLDE